MSTSSGWFKFCCSRNRNGQANIFANKEEGEYGDPKNKQDNNSNNGEKRGKVEKVDIQTKNLKLMRAKQIQERREIQYQRATKEIHAEFILFEKNLHTYHFHHKNIIFTKTLPYDTFNQCEALRKYVNDLFVTNGYQGYSISKDVGYIECKLILEIE